MCDADDQSPLSSFSLYLSLSVSISPLSCACLLTMPPFRNFLNRKPPLNGGDADSGHTNNNGDHLSPDPQRPSPLGIRRSCESVPNEYKLSGMSLKNHRNIYRGMKANCKYHPQLSTTAASIFQY